VLPIGLTDCNSFSQKQSENQLKYDYGLLMSFIIVFISNFFLIQLSPGIMYNFNYYKVPSKYFHEKKPISNKLFWTLFSIRKNIVRNAKFDCKQEYQFVSKQFISYFKKLKFQIFCLFTILAIYCQLINSDDQFHNLRFKMHRVLTWLYKIYELKHFSYLLFIRSSEY
jgi:hypothetical protein